MSTLQRLFTFASCIVLGTLTASAHPGHGEPGPAHYVTEADHVVPVVLVASAILCVTIVSMSLRKRRTADARED